MRQQISDVSNWPEQANESLFGHYVDLVDQNHSELQVGYDMAKTWTPSALQLSFSFLEDAASCTKPELTILSLRGHDERRSILSYTS
jgi:hypothetical protein